MSSLNYPLAPWHMWGNTIDLSFPLNQPTPGQSIASVQNQQLLRVNYGRPETWTFFVGAELVSGIVSDTNRVLLVQVNLQAGVGRTVFLTKSPLTVLTTASVGFVEFRWSILAGSNPVTQQNQRKWTTQAFTPPLDETLATPDDSRQIVQWFPAQDIQMEAQGQLGAASGSALDNSLGVKLTGWVAPRTHVRPEWYSEGEQFRGHEQGGT